MTCAVHNCKAEAVGACDFRPSTVREDGEREYGKPCGMKLCEAHTHPVAGRGLCAWHAVRAREMGVA